LFRSLRIVPKPVFQAHQGSRGRPPSRSNCPSLSHSPYKPPENWPHPAYANQHLAKSCELSANVYELSATVREHTIDICELTACVHELTADVCELMAKVRELTADVCQHLSRVCELKANVSRDETKTRRGA